MRTGAAGLLLACPYPGTVNGIGVLVYCGSAKATVKVGTKTVVFIAGSDAKPATKNGSYAGTTVLMTKSGQSYLADALTLTLTHNARAGTLAGTIETTRSSAKLAFHATFTC